MVERSLSMREVRGSIPCTSNNIFIFFLQINLGRKTVNIKLLIQYLMAELRVKELMLELYFLATCYVSFMSLILSRF